MLKFFSRVLPVWHALRKERSLVIGAAGRLLLGGGVAAVVGGDGAVPLRPPEPVAAVVVAARLPGPSSVATSGQPLSSRSSCQGTSTH